jgi:hypothetical protein
MLKKQKQAMNEQYNIIDERPDLAVSQAMNEQYNIIDERPDLAVSRKPASSSNRLL